MSKIPAPKPRPPHLSKRPAGGFNWQVLWWYIPTTLLLLWIWQDLFAAVTIRTISYSEFKEHVERSEVEECKIGDEQIVGSIVLQSANEKPVESTSETVSSNKTVDRATTKESIGEDERKVDGTDKSDNKTDKFLFRVVRVDDPKLVEHLEKAGVKFVGVRPSLLSQFLLSWILPIGIMFLLWTMLSRRLGSAGQAVMNIGKSKATLVADQDTGVNFGDVAGCDEAKFELQEVVDFLQNPDRYTQLGAKIPKGVLLVGPPGTGKTLLARAVAGEAKVPFFSLSGSDFVEMFVGVGASRVRDLFDQATKNAPCIIFIDELDAIGRQRGVHVGAVNDEREQTLNQLLVEMDGFEANVGVILLAATNRPEVLDRALLRPGRFDRQIVVDAPDLAGRLAILKVHSRNKPLDADVELRKIAQGTPGMSGADLANVLNEAALLSARHDGKVIKQKDIEDAVEKVIAGPERRSRLLGTVEKKRVAFHEVGHALVAAYSPHSDPVHKISIVPRGRAALGYTLHLPSGEQFLLTRSEIIDRLKGLLGGRAAEQVVYGEVSTGAENDLERATAMARQMVCMYGMSEKIGLIHCARRESMFMPDQGGALDCSDATANAIDIEVRQILDAAYQDAQQILVSHRDQLDAIANELLEKETLDSAAFRSFLTQDHTADRLGDTVAGNLGEQTGDD
ncbi:MAG: ATP-dependent zinc metalloprotease FtsH [Planctomycetota bacterium]|nr:ATP-dependent zinc metalloprotease FtsH [Planctomycetota bacterium]MDA1178731.1 ATP-dependent zinc metalloprotease FtsH [Planctomycetota bacterium]